MASFGHSKGFHPCKSLNLARTDVFSLKFGIPMSVCLVLILHFMRKPCKYFLLKKARKISLPFGRTLHSKLPRRPKSPQKHGELGKSLLRVLCLERGAPPTLKNTAIRFDPYANNLWVNSNAGKTSPPGSRTKGVPGGDFWLVKPGSRIFSRHPGPQSNNTKSGEMPMSPANSAPDPPHTQVRNNPNNIPDPSGKSGGGVSRWGPAMKGWRVASTPDTPSLKLCQGQSHTTSQCEP